jgi:hypothetical protein
MSLNLITLSLNTLIINAISCCLKFAFCELPAAAPTYPGPVRQIRDQPGGSRLTSGCIETGQFLYRKRTTALAISAQNKDIQHIKCWHVIERNKSTSTNSNKEL